MTRIKYNWRSDDSDHAFDMVHVQGTNGRPFLFGEGEERRPIEVPDFYIATIPVTQALWTHVMGAERNPSGFRGDGRPVDNVSWRDVTQPAGFLDRINTSRVVAGMVERALGHSSFNFRLPSETEWEYAARGGRHWMDNFQFSGSDDIEAVAWYEKNSGGTDETSVLSPLQVQFAKRRHTETHDVGLKAPNQLGIYDMSGNVWEWCQDCFTRDTSMIPADGTPLVSDNSDRILRGGCHHNWAMHCTVSKRYEIVSDHHDECVGFRLALAVS